MKKSRSIGLRQSEHDPPAIKFDSAKPLAHKKQYTWPENQNKVIWWNITQVESLSDKKSHFKNKRPSYLMYSSTYTI